MNQGKKVKGVIVKLPISNIPRPAPGWMSNSRVEYGLAMEGGRQQVQYLPFLETTRYLALTSSNGRREAAHNYQGQTCPPFQRVKLKILSCLGLQEIQQRPRTGCIDSYRGNPRGARDFRRRS
jgi:hypothetical protein